MKPFLQQFNNLYPIDWAAEDIQKNIEKMNLDPSKLSSTAVAYQSKEYYLLFWEHGQTPSLTEAKALLNRNGIKDENIYDLTKTSLML